MERKISLALRSDSEISGVAMLFKEKLQFEIINSKTDLDGRY